MNRALEKTLLPAQAVKVEEGQVIDVTLGNKAADIF